MPRPYYELEENPEYTEDIEQLSNSDPVLAESGFFHDWMLRIMNNMKALFQRMVPNSRRVNGHALTADVTVTKADVGLGKVDNTADTEKSVASAVSASSAAKLTTARTIAISGGATGTATAFDGSANITIPVTGLDMSKATAGTLSVTRGGTGATSLSSITVGKAGSASTLTTARTIAISGGATGTATSFNGSANITIPVTALNPDNLSKAVPVSKGGTGQTSVQALRNSMGLGNTTGALPIANGGTGSTSAAAARTALGAAASSHSHPASQVTAGTLPTGVLATNSTDYGTSRLRNVRASTTDLTAGSSALSNGEIYLVYE